MGWIKVNLEDDYHDRLRDIVGDSDDPTHIVARQMLQEYMDNDE